MPRVLVVSYPWLPAFNAGVRHAAILCRYLPEAGWDPIILSADWTEGAGAADAPLGITLDASDEPKSLRAARAVPAVSAPAAERENAPLRWHAALHADDEAGPATGIRRVARAALDATYPFYGEFPDAFRGWVPAAVVAGLGAVRQYGIGAVISFSSPDSAHIAAGEIARRAGVPWIPVFGELGAFDVRRASGGSTLRRMQQRELARRWLRGASRAATVSPSMTASLQASHGIATDTLMRTFDPDERRLPPRRAPGAPLRMVHVGRLAPERQPAHLLLAALDLLAAADASLASRLRVELVGSGCDDLLVALLAGRPAAALVSVLPRVPLAEAVRLQREADVLLLLDSEDGDARYPATLFEHLNARRPSIAVAGDESIVAQVLRETRAGGHAATPDALAAAIRAAMQELDGAAEVPFKGDEASIARYGGPEQARRLAAMLDVASAERIGSWQRG